MTPTEPIVPPFHCYCGKPDCKIPYGLCHCGCKGKTKISTITHSQHKWIKGQPILYICGHNRWPRPKLEDAIPFKIDGVYCRLIPLTKGFYAIVDAADYEWLMQWKWTAVEKKCGIYATRGTSRNSKRKVIYMHRQILGLTEGDVSEGDHIETGETLDNRRLNLRPASHDQNCHNTRVSKANKSGRKGVYWSKRIQKWCVMIRVKGKRIWLGAYVSFEEACAVREAAELKYHGEFARAR